MNVEDVVSEHRHAKRECKVVCIGSVCVVCVCVFFLRVCCVCVRVVCGVCAQAHEQC